MRTWPSPGSGTGHSVSSKLSRFGAPSGRLLSRIWRLTRPAIGILPHLRANDRARSGLAHIGRQAAGQEVLARRREHVDHLGVLEHPALVLDPARDHRNVARHADAPLAAEPEFHLALEHPEHLLVRMLVGGRMRPGL